VIYVRRLPSLHGGLFGSVSRSLLFSGFLAHVGAQRRGDIDLESCTIRVVRALAQMNDGTLIDDEPKSRAGRRVVSVPLEIVPELRWHLERFALDRADGLVFVGPKGGRLRRSNFRDVWIKACDEVGRSGVHLHDLRHTGEHLGSSHGR
jgi:integrase